MAIDLFSLYVLFSQYRSCVNTLENYFFQVLFYSLAYVCIIYEKIRVKFPWDFYWDSKTYKVKRSTVTSQYFFLIVSAPLSNVSIYWVKCPVVVTGTERHYYKMIGIQRIFQVDI